MTSSQVPEATLAIPLAKGTIALRVALAAVVVAGLTLLLFNDPRFHPLLMATCDLCALIALYFGICLLADQKPGLVFNNEGIAINRKIGFGSSVAWQDVSEVRLVSYQHASQLVITVNNPGPYLERGTWIIRFLNSVSYRIYGSPIRINASFLKYRRNDLLQTINTFRAASTRA